MANQNYTIADVGSYITSMQDGGTILFFALLGSGDPSSPGQVWTIDDSFNNVTITCLFVTNTPLLYLTVSSAAEGEHIGSAQTRTENSFWSIEGDGSLQLMNNGVPTKLYAVIDTDTGLLTLATTAKTKWKFSKTIQTIKGWET